MKDFPPVSVYIITCLSSRERGEILRDVCLNALELDYPEFEVVVGDNVGEISAAEALAAIKDPRLKVFRNSENLGFTGNINKCLDYCSHDIIKLHCDDDLLHPAFLKTTVPLIDDDTFAVVDYVEYVIGSEPEGLGAVLSNPPETELRKAGVREDFWTMPYISLPACTIFTRKLFEDVGCYDLDATLSDWDFLIEARRHKNVVHVKQVMTFMGVWAESASQTQLRTRPYYFSYDSLYTRFRYFYDQTLTPAQRRQVGHLIVGRFLKESTRLIKYFYRATFWKDYGVYIQKLLHYLRRHKAIYKHRNNAGDLK